MDFKRGELSFAFVLGKPNYVLKNWSIESMSIKSCLYAVQRMMHNPLKFRSISGFKYFLWCNNSWLLIKSFSSSWRSHQIFSFQEPNLFNKLFQIYNVAVVEKRRRFSINSIARRINTFREYKSQNLILRKSRGKSDSFAATYLKRKKAVPSEKLRPSRQISLLSLRLTQLSYLLSTFNNRSVRKLLSRSRKRTRGRRRKDKEMEWKSRKREKWKGGERLHGEREMGENRKI